MDKKLVSLGVMAELSDTCKVSDRDVNNVEAIVGMDHEAWDTLDPKELIAACWAAITTREVEYHYSYKIESFNSEEG